MSEIKLDKVHKSFGSVEVLHGVNIDIKDGEFVVFVGPSGCGKSTLLRLIAGLEPITSGDMYIGEKWVNDLSPVDRGIAMVFQSYALYPHMTVYKNMAFGLKMGNQGKAEIEKRVRNAAEILQLTPLLARKPSQLSGGQRQRVAIGRAIVRDPEVFLFDEPLSNLDAALRVQTRLEIAKLHQELKNTVVYVTHDQVEAMTLADKIVVLHDGNVEQIGSPLDLYNHPANLFVAGFIGSPKMNFFEGRITSIGKGQAAVKLADGKETVVPVEGAHLGVGGKLTLGIRPEHLELEVSSGGPVVGGHVDVVERLGDVSYLYVRANGDAPFIASLPGTSDVQPGTEISLGTDPIHVHVFNENGNAITNARNPAL